MIKDVMLRLDGTAGDGVRLAAVNDIAELFDSQVIGLAGHEVLVADVVGAGEEARGIDHRALAEHDAVAVDFSLGSWRGIAGPKGLPQPITDKLAAALKKVQESKDFRDFMNARGFALVWQAPASPSSWMTTTPGWARPRSSLSPQHGQSPTRKPVLPPRRRFRWNPSK